MGKARAQDKEAKVTQIALRISHIEKFVSARILKYGCFALSARICIMFV